MDEPERLAKYRKDPSAESRLEELNAMLRPVQLAREAGLDGPEHPVVFIIGAPRSGTTLVSQLLARSGQFGYVSNFVARFWHAPAVGALIERSLAMRTADTSNAYESNYGVTRGWASPHEFGYFWSYWFDRGQRTHVVPSGKLAEIDRGALRRRIASLEAVYAQPLAFKNNTWCTFQASWLADAFPSAIFVVCRRDPLYLAQSLLLARRERLGSSELWWSVRPPTYDRIRTLPWWEQVVAQALDTERTMLQEVRRIAPARVIEAPYADVCADPIALVRSIARCCELPAHAHDADYTGIPTSFASTDVRKLDDAEWTLLQDSLRRLND